MLDERLLLLFSHLLFHRRNYMGAHLSAAGIHLVLQGSETGKAHGAILPYMGYETPSLTGETVR